MEDEEVPPIHISAVLYPFAAAFLQAHGCTIHIDTNPLRTTVTLPPGATRTLLPSRTASERFAIALPGSVIIRQVYDPSSGHSALFIPTHKQEEAAGEQ